MIFQKQLEKLYSKLPLFLQNIGISFFGIYWFNRRYSGVFKKELIAAREREVFSKQDWIDYQTVELRKLLTHSFDNVPYYRERFKSSGLSRADLENFSLAQLPCIPFLEKKTFKLLSDSSLLSEKKEPNCEFFYSSGSTGTPTKTLYSKRMHQKYYAIFEARIHNWAGLNYKTPRGVIGGRRILATSELKGPFYRYNMVEKQTYFSAYHINPETIGNYLEGMKKNKVEYMTGYASANFFLARFIKEKKMDAPRMQAVLTSSEELTTEMREVFKEVYGCETFDSYNGVECCNLISECEHHRLHISPDVGIVEIINSHGQSVEPGQIGEVISTGLLNLNQPLIRYRMGDLVQLALNQTCACGRQMPIIEKIIGRVEDTVVGADGREMVRFHGIFINIPEILKSQIIQHSILDFNIKLVLKDRVLSDESRELIISRMHSQLGKKIHIQIDFVDDIPPGPNGKFKAVVSMVQRSVSQ